VNLPARFLEQIATAGTLAPSGDNLQPWRLRIDNESLLVVDDRDKDHSLFNVHNLASYIALGAVLENVLIAATRYNYRANIYYFPDSQEHDLISRISFNHGTETDPLVDSIEKRCTNRKPYERRALDGATTQRLNLDPNRFSRLGLTWLHDQASLNKLGAIVSRADRLLFENPLIHSHLFSTLRWSAEEVERTRDGLPIETLELGSIGSKAFRALRKWSVVKILNTCGFSAMAARQSAMLMRRCSAAGLITAPDTSPLSFLQVGQVFQRLWLQATKENLALQPMTAVVFLQLRSILGDHQGLTPHQITTASSLREDLAKIYAVSPVRIPAMHFRIGYAPPPSGRTIRRQVPKELGARI
jgi:nitroreductase